jgi:DNA-binding NtrC family response regulator
MRSAVVILENLSIGNLPLEALAAEFGWSLERVFSHEALSRLAAERIVPAVLFDPRSLRMAWHQAPAFVRQEAPNSHPILCYRFSELITWSELVNAGAFHSLRLPLDLREVRQSFGFVWAATSSASKNLGSMPAPSRIPALRALATDGDRVSDQKFGERKGPQAARAASAG